jgi:NADPH:quinone reductase-like Zn-dependent oxidoreductase
MDSGGGDVAADMPFVVVAAAFGGPEVLSLIEEPTAEPGPGQARIAVRAAGVNPVDYKSYAGAFGAGLGRLPVRPGFEAAGVVTAVGPDAR